MDLAVIVPSRGRPEAAQALVDAFRDTCTADTVLLFAVDNDDERLPGYRGVVQFAEARNVKAGYLALESRTMVEALNSTAVRIVDEFAADPPFAVGFMGDDHCPRTRGWDAEYLSALRDLGTGIVYGDDLLQRQNLPTQCAMTADIVRALGYMAPPALTHLYVDDFWKHLGLSADCLQYLPDVVVEHRHPIAGKAEWTEGHVRVNAPEMYDKDRAAYQEYLHTRFHLDVAKVRELRG